MTDYYAHLRQKIGNTLLLVPGVAAIVRDERGHIPLPQKRDGTWSLPAGAIEPGESPNAALVRDVAEETGLEGTPNVLVGVFGGKGFRYTYANGGQV